MKFLSKIFDRLHNEEYKIIASNYISLSILQIANYLLPLIVLPYLVRVLGTEKFGLIIFAQALATFLTVFTDFGFNISGTREISLNKKDKKKISGVFWSIMTIKFFLTIIALIILVLIVRNFNRFEVEEDVYFLSFGIVIGQAIFPQWFFQGIEKMKIVTLVNIFAKVIFTVLVFVLVKEETEYLYVPLFNSLGYIIAGIAGLFISLRYVQFQKPNFNLIKKLFTESTSLFVSNLATMLYTYGNVFILGIFTGNTMVGIYSSMEKLILAIKNIYTPFYQAIYPWLSKQSNQIKITTIAKIKPVIAIVGGFATIFILLFGKKILDIIYDDTLISSYVYIFKILAIISLFSGISMMYNTLFFPSIKKYKTRMYILISAGIYNLILSFILVPLYGISGTAITVVSTELLLLFLGSFYYKKYIKEWRKL